MIRKQFFTFSLFYKSPACYRELSNFLILPHPRTFRRYMSTINSSVESKQENIKYLKSQFSHLGEHEKFVALKFDEIQIKSKVEYRGGKLYGLAENREDELAHHIQAFMIKSISSNYSEMVRLTPVTRNNSDFLTLELKSIINDLESVGFKVVALTSDNASINRNSFENICLPNETYFLSENHKDMWIYAFFDALHMIKSIRNN